VGVPESVSPGSSLPVTRGLVLVTGPHWIRAKTTAAASLLDLANHAVSPIVTIGDRRSFCTRHKRCLVSQRGWAGRRLVRRCAQAPCAGTDIILVSGTATSNTSTALTTTEPTTITGHVTHTRRSPDDRPHYRHLPRAPAAEIRAACSARRCGSRAAPRTGRAAVITGSCSHAGDQEP